jgi:hypothetical protein
VGRALVRAMLIVCGGMVRMVELERRAMSMIVSSGK